MLYWIYTQRRNFPSPLNIILPQLSEYSKNLGGDNKCVIFLVAGKKLLKKYSEI